MTRTLTDCLRTKYEICICESLKIPKSLLKESKNIGLKIVQPEKNFEIFVANKFSKNFTCLKAFNIGAKILNFSWLEKSILKEEILDFKDFITIDTEFERKNNFSYQNSKNTSLLNNKKFWISNMESSKVDLENLIQSMGGVILNKKPNKDCFIIVSKDRDKRLISTLRKNKEEFYEPELIYHASLNKRLNLNLFKLK